MFFEFRYLDRMELNHSLDDVSLLLLGQIVNSWVPCFLKKLTNTHRVIIVIQLGRHTNFTQFWPDKLFLVSRVQSIRSSECFKDQRCHLTICMFHFVVNVSQSREFFKNDVLLLDLRPLFNPFFDSLLKVLHSVVHRLFDRGENVDLMIPKILCLNTLL